MTLFLSLLPKQHPELPFLADGRPTPTSETLRNGMSGPAVGTQTDSSESFSEQKGAWLSSHKSGTLEGGAASCRGLEDFIGAGVLPLWSR